MDGTPSVIKKPKNEDGGYTYLVLFPTSMKDVPQLDVYLADIPVSIVTLQNGNVLGGSFRLEFQGETTSDIPYDADAAEIQQQLEMLSTVGKVSVYRSNANEQNGFSWEVEFLSDQNSGDLENLITHGELLTTTNPDGHANIEISPGGIDGSYIKGSFQLEFQGEVTLPIDSNADVTTMKLALESLSTVGNVKVSRSEESIIGGYTWFITFLKNHYFETSTGDLPPLSSLSQLTGGSGGAPTIEVREIRKRSRQEVQTIRIFAGGDEVDPLSKFKLNFMGQSTAEIRALPLGGETCLGSTSARQVITSSTEDTSDIGGDDSVSPLTKFRLMFYDYTTEKIDANAAPCPETSKKIQEELNKIPALSEVSVSGGPSGANDGGCIWIVTFKGVDGNPDLLNVTAYHGVQSTETGTTATVGPNPSIVRDTISVTQPVGFEGDTNIIQSELSKLSSIGLVTVSSSDIDSRKQCSYRVTFQTKAGNAAAIHVHEFEPYHMSTNITLSTGDVIVIEDNTVQATSMPISGDFVLGFDGQWTAYMPHNVSSEAMTLALEEMETVGKVKVKRYGPDENYSYTWDVTFLTNLGSLPLLVIDDQDMRGTAVSASVVKVRNGVPPSFDGPEYQFHTHIDLSNLSYIASALKQGVNYYFRLRASNELGAGPATVTCPPFVKPMPQPPGPPSSVQLSVIDGSSLSVEISKPLHPFLEGYYRIDYSVEEFRNEKQLIALLCNSKPEIQSITTSARDINEIQYVVLDSAFKNNGCIAEIQRVQCDATGGFFGLTLAGETAFINYDATETMIKEALSSLSMIDNVSVTFTNGRSMACQPFSEDEIGDFIITLESAAGNLPLMTALTNSLEGARRVDIDTVQDGDAPLGGFFYLQFRGETTNIINASLPVEDIATLIQDELESLDSVESKGIIVTAVHLVHGGNEKIFSVEFQGGGVGGNVEALDISDDSKILGSGASISIMVDGEVYIARNGIDNFHSRPGNVLTGSFRLKLNGHATADIPFNAGADLVQARLEALPSIIKVSVKVGQRSQVLGFTWIITFLESSGYFPPPSRNLDALEAESSLSTTVDNGESVSINVNTIQDGDDPLTGKFSIGYFDGITVQTTAPLYSFISSDDLQIELESLPNVGRVEVERKKLVNGYAWEVEFAGCSYKGGRDVCSEGNLFPFILNDVNLMGCGGVKLNVTEIVQGSGPGLDEHGGGKIGTSQGPAPDDFLFTQNINGLSTGMNYFVQVRLRNEQGWGTPKVSSPISIAPHHGPPGKPPPVELISSSTNSITVGWKKPKSNGGMAVSGYELLMDNWNGGSGLIIYDGKGQPDIMQFTVTTNDIGPMNQVVESGRQYLFSVRAINNCNIFDPVIACHGPYSEPQIFLVRDPRSPLPPAAPKRDSRSSLINNSEASIVVTWDRPLDNGGSPITGYIIYMKRSDDSVISNQVDSKTTAWTASSLDVGEIVRFHVVALNSFGRSGNSPVLTTLAAVNPGLNYSLFPTYSFEQQYRPRITAIEEASITIEWDVPASNIQGGTPITGYKLYIYEGVGTNSVVTQEIQEISFHPYENSVVGLFTVLFQNEESDDISVHAPALDVKAALENLPSINVVSVSMTRNGWRITFESEAGDLPLMQVTTGRITGFADISVSVEEVAKGTAAKLLFDGSDQPDNCIFTATELTTDAGYAFKVAPVNAIGDGALSAVSITAIPSTRAAASQTTASGSALIAGIAGTVAEEQLVVFVTEDCDSNQLVLSLGNSGQRW